MMLDEEIKVAFDAISLLLVFVTVFFDLKYKVIQEHLKEDVPTGEKAKQRLKDKLFQCLFLNCGLLVIINGVIAFMFAPIFVKIIIGSKLDFWNFQFIRTAFVLVSLMTFGFFVWSIGLSSKVIIKIRSISKP